MTEFGLSNECNWISACDHQSLIVVEVTRTGSEGQVGIVVDG